MQFHQVLTAETTSNDHEEVSMINHCQKKQVSLYLLFISIEVIFIQLMTSKTQSQPIVSAFFSKEPFLSKLAHSFEKLFSNRHLYGLLLPQTI